MLQVGMEIVSVVQAKSKYKKGCRVVPYYITQYIKIEIVTAKVKDPIMKKGIYEEDEGLKLKI